MIERYQATTFDGVEDNMTMTTTHTRLMKLAADWNNPSPDRRERYDWTKLPKVEAGAFFVITERKDGDGTSQHAERVSSSREFGRLSEGQDAWHGFAALLTPADISELTVAQQVAYLKEQRWYGGMETMVRELGYEVVAAVMARESKRLDAMTNDEAEAYLNK